MRYGDEDRNIGNIDSVFVFRGYSNWKDASREREVLNNHERSTVHKNTVELVVTLPRFTRDVGELLSSAHAQEKRANRRIPSEGDPEGEILSKTRFSTVWGWRRTRQ